jgi:hypothetical protein
MACLSPTIQIPPASQTLDVLNMGMKAGADVAGRSADDLSVLDDLFTALDGSNGEFVPVWNQFMDSEHQPLATEAHYGFFTNPDVTQGGCHVILFLDENSILVHSDTLLATSTAQRSEFTHKVTGLD